MFSIPYLLTQLYPKRGKDDLQSLVERCLADGLEYDSKSWATVTRHDLELAGTQVNLVRTLWQMQFYYHGVGEEIFRSFEEWSDDRTMMFLDFEQEIYEFYERYTAFLGFVILGNLSANTIVKLLGSRFLLLASAWDVSIYDNLQIYFGRYANVYSLQEDANFFAKAMELNKTPIGEDGKGQHTVGEWAVKFKNFFGRTFKNKVDEFFEDNLETSRLSPETQVLLNKILTLYYGLQGGFIWREITNQVPDGYVRTAVHELNPDETYLRLLQEFDADGIKEWLASYRDVADWIRLTRKTEDFVNRLFYVLTQKVNLFDDEQAALLSEFIHSMQESGWNLGADMLYFDEQAGQFRWNQDIVSALKEEVEYLQSRPAEETTATGATPQPPKDIAPGIQELLS